MIGADYRIDGAAKCPLDGAGDARSQVVERPRQPLFDGGSHHSTLTHVLADLVGHSLLDAVQSVVDPGLRIECGHHLVTEPGGERSFHGGVAQYRLDNRHEPIGVEQRLVHPERQGRRHDPQRSQHQQNPADRRSNGVTRGTGGLGRLQLRRELGDPRLEFFAGRLGGCNRHGNHRWHRLWHRLIGRPHPARSALDCGSHLELDRLGWLDRLTRIGDSSTGSSGSAGTSIGSLGSLGSARSPRSGSTGSVGSTGSAARGSSDSSAGGSCSISPTCLHEEGSAGCGSLSRLAPRP